MEQGRPARAPRRSEPHQARERDRHGEHSDHRTDRERDEVGDLGHAGRRGCDEQHQERGAPRETMQQAEPQRAARIYLRMLVFVRRPLCVAMEMKVRAAGMRVHVEMPPSPCVSQDHGPSEPDEEQRHQQVGHGPEPVGKTQPEQDDRAHHDADARGVAQRPGEAQATSVEQAALARRERRDRGEVVRLERVTEAQQQAEAREGEKVGGGAHGGSESTVTILPCASARLELAFPMLLQPFSSMSHRMRHMELTTPGVATLRRDPDQRALGDAETADAALAASGDGRAFERLYRAHVARVHSLVRRMIGPDHADDIAQDVFVRAWTKLPTFRGEAAFGTWLHRLAVNVILARRTTLSTERGRYHDSADILDGVSGRPAAPELSMDFEEAIGRLPDGARQVFVLHDIEGYRHEEIADMLGIVAGTSKSQLHHARMALRKHLER